MNIELRKQLDTIPTFEITQQPARLEELRTHFGHTILTLDSDHLFFNDGSTYNCFAYALSLVGQEGYIDIASSYPGDVSANSEFILFLLENGYIKETTNDGIVVYFSDSARPTHAGFIAGNSVISKWGTGLLFKHNIYDLPYSYGSEFKKYYTLTSEASLEYFYDFAETRGWQFE